MPHFPLFYIRNIPEYYPSYSQWAHFLSYLKATANFPIFINKYHKISKPKTQDHSILPDPEGLTNRKYDLDYDYGWMIKESSVGLL